MIFECCERMYISPSVQKNGFEMNYWNDAGKGDEKNETTIAIKSPMKDLEVREKKNDRLNPENSKIVFAFLARIAFPVKHPGIHPSLP